MSEQLILRQIELEYKNINQLQINNLNELGQFLVKLGFQIVNLRVLRKKSQQDVQEWISYYGELIDWKQREVEMVVRVLRQQMINFQIGVEVQDEIEKEYEYKFNDELGWENNNKQIKYQIGNQYSQIQLNNNQYFQSVFKDLIFVDRVKSEFSEIEVYDSVQMGRILVLDGQIQFSDIIEDNYTSHLTGLVIQDKDHIYQNVLILGGGDLIIAQYLLNNFINIKQLTLCEIDQNITQIVQKYFKKGQEVQQQVLEQNRFNLVFQDGSIFIKDQVQKQIQFDAIIIDNSDPDFINSPANSLFTVEFFKNIYASLKPGASFCQQSSDDNFTNIWKQRVTQAGFTSTSVIKISTPEYSCDLPLVKATKPQI